MHLFSLQDFDAVLTDPMVPTGALIARKLGEPSEQFWVILHLCLILYYLTLLYFQASHLLIY